MLVQQNRSECDWFENFKDCVNKLQNFKVEVIEKPTIDNRLHLIKHP